MSSSRAAVVDLVLLWTFEESRVRQRALSVLAEDPSQIARFAVRHCHIFVKEGNTKSGFSSRI